MPQAIERLLATPITNPRLPCIRVPAGTSPAAPGRVMSAAPCLFLHQCGALRERAAASYTNRPCGPGNVCGLSGQVFPCRSWGLQLGQQRAELLGLGRGQARTERRADRGRVHGPHLPPQRTALGGNPENIVAPIALTLMALDQPLALQPVNETAHMVLSELRAVLYA